MMIETALICGILAKELVYGKIVEVSQDFGVSEGQLTYIIENESARTKDGDFLPCGVGDKHMPKPSIGVAQISMHYHPDVDRESASQLMFSLEWTATKLREGKCSLWTTCRKYEKLWPKLNT